MFILYILFFMVRWGGGGLSVGVVDVGVLLGIIRNGRNISLLMGFLEKRIYHDWVNQENFILCSRRISPFFV